MSDFATEPRSCDLTVFAAHPDDAELVCGGTLALCARRGWRTAVVDFTRGELSTRGTPEERAAETEAASRTLGLDQRICLGLPDGHLRDDEAAREAVVRVIRAQTPSVVIAPPLQDHHPDHMAVGEVVSRSFWLAGVKRYAPGLEPWRPDALLHYVGSRPERPHLVVPVDDVIDVRREAVACYRSQLYDPASMEIGTRISSPRFLDWVEGRLRHFGFLVGAGWGEGFTSPEPVPAADPVAIFGRGTWESLQNGR